MKRTSAGLSLTAAIVVGLIAGGCGGLDDRERDLLSETTEASREGNWILVRQLSTELLSRNPDYGPALLLRGRALLELGETEAALADLESAERSGSLGAHERSEALLYRGRSWAEIGRSTVSDADFRSSTVPAQERRRARESFVKANGLLQQAVQLAPQSYEAQLWRAYALFRLENFRKAIDLLKEAGKLAPNRWEHRFVSAMALEGLYKVNSQSIEEYLSITAGAPRAEMAPVYEYLTSILGDLSPEVRRKLLDRISAFAAAWPQHSPRIDAFLAEARSRENDALRKTRRDAATQHIKDLIAREQIEEALAFAEAFIKDHGQDPEVQRLLLEAQERWSVILEVRTESLIRSVRKEDLEKALANYQTARKLTTKVDRLVVLHQKTSALELAIARLESSEKILQAHELLRAGKHDAVIKTLASVSLEGFTDHDRDLYHYLLGVAKHNLGQWTAAVDDFESLGQRNFDRVDLYHGLALIRSGQPEAGIALLAKISPRDRNDEVNRILGHHYRKSGDFQKAAECLAAIRSRTREDTEGHLIARKECGLRFYREGSFQRAIEEFQVARQVLEVELHQRSTDLYFLLGTSLYRVGETERAKAIYKDITESGLTDAEKKLCRDLYLHRAQIYLKEKAPDLAYADLFEFVRLGGELPEELVPVHARLVGTYADYVPLDRIQYWSYSSTTRDLSYSLHVEGSTKGEYRVDRRSAGNRTQETWQRQGVILTRRSGDMIDRYPISLSPAEESLPSVDYVSQGQACRGELLTFQEKLDLPGGRRFSNCLKVQITRKPRDGGAQETATREVIYLAPNVGEVKREIYRDDTKLSETVLSDFALKLAGLSD